MNPAREPDPRRGKRILLALAALFVAPVIASYLAYYYLTPQGRTNYGTLVEPQRPVARLALVDAAGGATALSTLAGRWLIVAVDDGRCAQDCAGRLALMRQLRLSTGKDRERIERVLLVTGPQFPASRTLEDFAGTIVLRAQAGELAALFPLEDEATLADHLYLVDPLGNLMMRYPKSPDGSRIRKDLERLLRASRIG
ncbi:MAG: cytochrome C oxidase subunit I [Burkholderiaceae bacterium]|nr:cytochrome C oxidase subunit I [Burkholderiaceae bacterium]